nr:hypothetical protein [Tanacetum cinerariifolium]
QIELDEPLNDVNTAPAHTLKGDGSGAPTEPQTTPSPTHPSTGDQPHVTESSSSHDTTQDSRDSLEGTNRSERDQLQSPYEIPFLGDHTSDRAEETVKDAQAAEIIALKARIKKLEKRCKPSISYHRAWLKIVQSTLDDLDVDHDMDTEEPMNQGRLSEETEKLVNTIRPGDSIVRPDVGTADPIVPLTTTTSILDDEDITMDQTLIKMKEEKAKEKGLSINDIEDSSRPTRSILTLKPLLTINPKAKELTELEREKEKRQREEEASKAAIAEMYDEVQAGIEADALLAAKIQQEEREEVIDDFKPMDSDDAVEKEKVLEKPDNTKIEVKQEGDEENIRKRPGRRLKMKATKKSKRKKTDSDLKEKGHLKTFQQIVPNEEGEVDYEVLDKRFPIINWESKFCHLNRHGVDCIYYIIFKSDRSSRWIKTFSEMVTRFDRMDLEELYNLVMQRFETTSPEGVDLVLWVI